MNARRALLLSLLLSCTPSAQTVARADRRAPMRSLASSSIEDASRAVEAPSEEHSFDAATDASVGESNADPITQITARSLEARLADHEVDDDHPWRQTVYSWLTPQRAAELAQHRQLLTATTNSGPYVSPFSRLLARLQRRRDRIGAIAHALYVEPDLYRYRYAWSSPFATATGFKGLPYGSSLVRVDLRPDALVLRLDPQDPQRFRLFDREQREVPIERFQQVRARIGAVYHVRRDDVNVPFREYVLCNSAAVAHWSIGTPAVCDEVAAELRLVEDALAEWGSIAPRPASPRAHIELEWRASTRSTQRTPFSRWAATMATAAPHYYLDANNLRALATQLQRFDPSTIHEE